jgi:hypothetical protein
MTAVEYLIEQLRQLAHNPNTHLGMGDIRVTQGMIDEIEEQAKQMEKDKEYETKAYWFGRGILAGRENKIEELSPKRGKL